MKFQDINYIWIKSSDNVHGFGENQQMGNIQKFLAFACWTEEESLFWPWMLAFLLHIIITHTYQPRFFGEPTKCPNETHVYCFVFCLQKQIHIEHWLLHAQIFKQIIALTIVLCYVVFSIMIVHTYVFVNLAEIIKIFFPLFLDDLLKDSNSFSEFFRPTV